MIYNSIQEITNNSLVTVLKNETRLSHDSVSIIVEYAEQGEKSFRFRLGKKIFKVIPLPNLISTVLIIKELIFPFRSTLLQKIDTEESKSNNLIEFFEDSIKFGNQHCKENLLPNNFKLLQNLVSGSREKPLGPITTAADLEIVIDYIEKNISVYRVQNEKLINQSFSSTKPIMEIVNISNFRFDPKNPSNAMQIGEVNFLEIQLSKKTKKFYGLLMEQK
jgi:hypothetical protein